MQTEYNKRFSYLIDILKEKYSVPEKKIGITIGIKSSAINSLKSGRSKKASKSAEILLKKEYGVNINWLESGEGEVFLKGSSSEKSIIQLPGEAVICINCEFGAYTKDFNDSQCPDCNGNIISKCSRCGEKIIIPAQRFCHKCGMQLKT